ncbi:hypothetical protein K438DRAFT_2050226 [Mycena galopus ATCC 62051]|nr:hypothetical protein K438DRAFT_2050226 [Mycena galopus ATCC 62051]
MSGADWQRRSGREERYQTDGWKAAGAVRLGEAGRHEVHATPVRRSRHTRELVASRDVRLSSTSRTLFPKAIWAGETKPGGRGQGSMGSQTVNWRIFLAFAPNPRIAFPRTKLIAFLIRLSASPSRANHNLACAREPPKLLYASTQATLVHTSSLHSVPFPIDPDGDFQFVDDAGQRWEEKAGRRKRERGSWYKVGAEGKQWQRNRRRGDFQPPPKNRFF